MILIQVLFCFFLKPVSEWSLLWSYCGVNIFNLYFKKVQEFDLLGCRAWVFKECVLSIGKHGSEIQRWLKHRLGLAGCLTRYIVWFLLDFLVPRLCLSHSVSQICDSGCRDLHGLWHIKTPDEYVLDSCMLGPWAPATLRHTDSPSATSRIEASTASPVTGVHPLFQGTM